MNHVGLGSSGALDLIEDEDSMVAEQSLPSLVNSGLVSTALDGTGTGSPDEAMAYAGNLGEMMIGGERGVNDGASNIIAVSSDFLIERSALDIEAYASQFEGVARLQRLLFIAEHCPPLRRDALVLALTSLRNSNSKNTRAYEQICEQLLRFYHSTATTENGSSSGSAATANSSSANQLPASLGQIPDRAWLDTTKRQVETTQAHLEADLKSYRTSSIKESIRRTYEELGAFFVECGDYDAALRHYSRARENVTTPKSLLSTTLAVIRVAVYKQAWAVVSSFLNKSELHRRPDEPLGSAKDEAWWAQTRCQLVCLAGLADLVHGRYKQAARNFTSAPGQQAAVRSSNHNDAVSSAAAVAAAAVDPCSGFADLLSPNCVAIYGAICAMASMDRSELHRMVLANAHFRSLLELEPDFREMLRSFYDTKYTNCIQAMDRVRDTLRLDIFLSPHVNHLFNEIRRRVLVQYFSPYSAVDLGRMSAAVGNNILAQPSQAVAASDLAASSNTVSSIQALEAELAQLVVEGQLSARIDTQAKVLRARDTDHRAQTFSRVMQLGHEYALAARALLLRHALLRANVSVRVSSGAPTSSTQQLSSQMMVDHQQHTLPHHGSSASSDNAASSSAAPSSGASSQLPSSLQKHYRS